MPYIEQKARVQIADGAPPANAGELNYKMTMRCINNTDAGMLASDIRKIADEYIAHKGLRYQYINDVGGAFLWASREFVRRTGSIRYRRIFERIAAEFYDEVAAPYEDIKIKENGDCYWVETPPNE